METNDENEVFGLGCNRSPVDSRDIPLDLKTINKPPAPMQLARTSFFGSLFFRIYDLIRFFSFQNLLGWLPFSKKTSNLPASVDLRSSFPEPYNQGHLGSCVANAVCGIIDYNQMLNSGTLNMPSRLACYYDARELHGQADKDAGCDNRSALKVATHGVCPETEWPYDITKVFVAPPSDSQIRISGYRWVKQTEKDLKETLAAGYPVLIAVNVYTSFESPAVRKTGIVPLPVASEALVGSHALVLVGYITINGKSYFITRNSWGTKFGDKGYLYLPVEFVTNEILCFDLWVVLR